VEFRHYLKVILKGWWLVLPALLSSLIAALVFTYSQTPIYRTSATFVVSPSANLSTIGDVVRGLDTLTKRDSILSTYAAIATSRFVRSEIDQELNLTPTQKENLNISGELIQPTNIIEILVESDDPDLAKTTAILVGEKTIEYVGNLYELYDIKPLDPPYAPRRPSKPDIVQNLLLAGILGLLVGVGLAFLLTYLRSSQEEVVGINIIDSETGVYNQRYFTQRLGVELSRAKRHQYALSLAMMNIEQLDMVRDESMRNEALRQVILFLTKHLRQEDLVARFKDDSFALLLPDTNGPDATRLLEGLQTRLQWKTFELSESGIKLNLSASFGIVAYGSNGISRDELLAKATDALKRAGDSGYGEIYLLDDKDE